MSEASTARFQTEETSMAKLLGLHLLPAMIMLIFYLPLSWIVNEKGIPTMFVFYVLVMLVLVPFELGFLYYQGKKIGGQYSLKGVVPYREKMPWWQYLVFGIISFAWLGLFFSGSSSFMDFLDTNLLAWIPDWFKLNVGTVEQNGPFVENAMLILGWMVIGVIAPATEELYFRGYLLPRLSKLGIWAPLVNVALFMLYHFWQPHTILIIQNV